MRCLVAVHAGAEVVIARTQHTPETARATQRAIDDAHALGVEVTEESSDAAWFAWDSAWQQLAEKIAAKAAE